MHNDIGISGNRFASAGPRIDGSNVAQRHMALVRWPFDHSPRAAGCAAIADQDIFFSVPYLTNPVTVLTRVRRLTVPLWCMSIY